MDASELRPLFLRATRSNRIKHAFHNLSYIADIGPKKLHILLLLLLAAVLLSGCDSSPSEAEVMKIFIAIVVSAALTDRKTKVLKEFDHFVKHRIRALIAENSSWDHPPKYEVLTVRISAE